MSCPKCEAEDIEIKSHLTKVFNREQMISMSIMVGQGIAEIAKKLKQAAPNNHLKAQNQANVDFLCTIISPFFVSMEEKDLAQVKNYIKVASGGVEFNVMHEACPHKELNA